MTECKHAQPEPSRVHVMLTNCFPDKYGEQDTQYVFFQSALDNHKKKKQPNYSPAGKQDRTMDIFSLSPGLPTFLHGCPV